MGFYINPPSETKEAFLERVGREITAGFSWQDVPQGLLPVVWVNNGHHTAAAIGYSENEFNHFRNPADTRPKRFYLVSIYALLTVCNDTRFRTMFSN